jgi:hypothetical protein
MRMAVVAFLALTLAACGENSTQAVDTDISIETTDLESVAMGEGQACVDRLSDLVNVEYLAEHDVTVADDAATAAAIKVGISEVCAQGPPDLTVHGAAHRVVHIVEEEVG